MRRILAVFLGDLKMLRHNAIAWLVLMGLVVVPPLYAWFNIAACWDPYGNTGNLKVAVANADTGYKGELFPIKLNIGDMVISELQKSRKMDWILTDEEAAILGVQEGKYYAAIVLPASFSTDMMSLFSPELEHSDILYFLNEKENAIAPKVTDKGASAVQQQINQVFIKTVTRIGLDLLDGVSERMDGQGEEQIFMNLAGNLRQLETQLSSAALVVRAYADMSGALQDLLDESRQYLGDSGTATAAGRTLLEEADLALGSLSPAENSASAAIDEIIASSSSAYADISAELDRALDELTDDSEAVQKTLKDTANEVSLLRDAYVKLRDALLLLSDSLPAGERLASRTLGQLIGRLDSAIEEQEHLYRRLNGLADDLDSLSGDAAASRAALRSAAQDTEDAVRQLKADYESGLQAKFPDLHASLRAGNAALDRVLLGLDDAADSAGKAGESLSRSLGELCTELSSVADMLAAADEDMLTLVSRLEKAAYSEDLDTMETLLENDPETLSDFLTAPVQLSTIKFYPVENYGSAMAPFYTLLSLWVGGVILAAILKVTLSEERRKALPGLSEAELYFGRYLLFLILGLLQSTLVCLGDLFYLGIQCEHPFYFLLAAWLSSIVFVNIIYTLTVSFGDIGKAICVILLVWQVAGTGGTFPVEMIPDFFRQSYQLLPFPYGMDAMREAIAGFYGNTYWQKMGTLLLFLPPSLFLGLVLRKPISHLNKRFSEKLAETKLI